MKISVKTKTRAQEEKVERLGQPSLGFNQKDNTFKIPFYKVSVKEAPEHGRANEAIVRALADYFHVPYSRVRLLSGQTSKNKIFEIVLGDKGNLS